MPLCPKHGPYKTDCRKCAPRDDYVEMGLSDTVAHPIEEEPIEDTELPPTIIDVLIEIRDLLKTLVDK